MNFAKEFRGMFHDKGMNTPVDEPKMGYNSSC